MGETFCEAVIAVSERRGALHNEIATVDELIDGADGACVCVRSKKRSFFEYPLRTTVIHCILFTFATNSIGLRASAKKRSKRICIGMPSCFVVYEKATVSASAIDDDVLPWRLTAQLIGQR